MKHGKSTNALMKHIRQDHHISINGSKEKKQLLNMGYYHGYKAVKFVKERNQELNLTKFSEVSAIYEYDTNLKTLLYPCLIKIETAIKNRTINYLVDKKDCGIEDIYKNILIDYKLQKKESKHKKYLKKKLQFRKKMDENISYHYGRNTTPISYYLHNSKPIPVWAYFEIITLGELSNFIDCMSLDSRKDLSTTIGINNDSLDQNGRMMVNTLTTLTGLRNATMHNSMIFDCRFNNSDTSKQVKQFYEHETKIKNIDFNYLIDFFIVVIFLLKNIDTPKRDLKKIVRDFKKNQKDLYDSLNFKEYSKITGTETAKKINNLLVYIES